MKMIVLLVLALAPVSFCATIKPTVTVACVPRAHYTAAEEKAIGDRLAALKQANPDDPLLLAMTDYTRVLREIDACNAGQSAKGTTP